MTESVSLLGFLRDYPGPCVLSAIVNDVASVVVKTEHELIEGFRGPITIGFHVEAGLCRTAAVVRVVLRFYDEPGNPYLFDTFLNPAVPQHLDVLRRFSQQDVVHIHFLDMECKVVLSKQIEHHEPSRQDEARLIEAVLAHNAAIPPGQFDYGAAKAELMEVRPMTREGVSTRPKRRKKRFRVRRRPGPSRGRRAVRR